MLCAGLHLNMQLLDLNFLPLTQFRIWGGFPAADKMGKSLSGEPWFTSGQTEGNMWIKVANLSGFFSLLGVVTKAYQHSSTLVLIHKALVLVFAIN